VIELRGNGLIVCLYAGNSLYIDITFCVRTDLQNVYALVKLFSRVSNKNMTASWTLCIALNLVAVTIIKARGLEICRHVQEETIHAPKNSV